MVTILMITMLRFNFQNIEKQKKVNVQNVANKLMVNINCVMIAYKKTINILKNNNSKKLMIWLIN